MPRAKVPLQSEFPYHVSSRCINREWFALPLDEVWDIYSRQLQFVSWAFEAEILAFVLMDNHFHMLIRTPDANLPKVMANLMKETSRYINQAAGRINQTYGSRYFRSMIKSHHYFLHAYKYVYRNPVQAGLCRTCEAYPYSSLNFLLGQNCGRFPVAEDTTLFSNIEGTLKWLNLEPDVAEWQTVKMALRRPQFKLPKDVNTKRAHRLEVDML